MSTIKKDQKIGKMVEKLEQKEGIEWEEKR